MRPSPAELTIVLACFAAAAEAFAPAPMLGSRSASKMALSKMAPKMSLETSVVEQVGQTLAGVVAIDGGTIGLEVSFGAFLAVILGLFIPVRHLARCYLHTRPLQPHCPTIALGMPCFWSLTPKKNTNKLLMWSKVL